MAGIGLTAAAATMANNWPLLMNGLSTAQPLPLQVGIVLVGGLIGGGLGAALFGLLAGHTAVPAAAATDRKPAVLIGLALGLGVLGVLGLAGSMLGPGLPPWSAYGPASAAGPWLGAALAPLQGYFALALLTLLIVTAANTLTAHWTRRQTAVGVALVLVGALLAPGTSPDDLLLGWGPQGGSAGCCSGPTGALLLGRLPVGSLLRDRPAGASTVLAAMRCHDYEMCPCSTAASWSAGALELLRGLRRRLVRVWCCWASRRRSRTSPGAGSCT